MSALLNDLNYVNSLSEPRLLILMLNLYFEHIVQQLSEELRIKKGSIKSKAEDLLKKGVILEGQFQVISLVYDLRNELMHKLTPNLERAERWIMDLNPDMQSFDDEFTEAFNISAAWTRIVLFAIPNIFDLFTKLKTIQGESLPHRMQIGLDKQYHFRFILEDNTAESTTPPAE